MNQEGKKQFIPTSDKDRRLKRLLDHFKTKKDKGNTSTSKKSKSVDMNDVDIDSKISYRILNFFSVFPILTEFLCCKTCGSDIAFQETGQCGLGFKLVVKCKQCEPKYIDSCPLIYDKYEVNKRFIFSMRLLGIGLNGVKKFCGLMDLPGPISKSFYNCIVLQIRTAVRSICNISLTASRQEEKMKTAEALNVSIEQDEPIELTVSGGGSWKTRGFCTSVFGVSTLIGYYTNKVIDIIVKSSSCKACYFWEKRSDTAEFEEWLQTHRDTCVIKYQDSPAVKGFTSGIQSMFLKSRRDVRYTNYIGDGDSKTYKAIIDSIPYPVTEKACINHLQKRMSVRLRKCKKENKELGGMGKLTGKLIDDLSTYYGLAICKHKDSVDEMYKAIWATLYHKSSCDETPKHDNCPEGPESWCTWQQAKATGQLSGYTHEAPLPDDVINTITPIYEDLSDKRLLKKCLGGFIQRNNGSFYNMIWEIAPETLLDKTVIMEIAAGIAVCIFNNGYTDILKIMEYLGIRIGPTALQFRDNEDERRISKVQTEVVMYKERF